MPPAISDDETESDGPDTIPAKAAKATPPKAEEDEDDDEDDEEYRVEKILAHGYGKGGAVIYQIKWLGYDEDSDLTWEPVENLDNALDILNEYHDSIGGAPEAKSKKKGSGGAKGGKRSASNAFDSPAVQPSASKASKRGRHSKSDTNGTTTLPTSLKKGTKDLPEGSWEEHVSRVSSIIEETDEKAVTGKGKGSKNLLGLLEWNNGRKTQHSLDTLRRKCPQRLLDYYEQHLKFDSTVEHDAD